MGWFGKNAEVVPMTEVERRLRDECEAKVRVGLKATAAVRDAGKALKTLKDNDLWRDSADSWESYCDSRFSLTTRRALQLIEFAGMSQLYENTIGTTGSGEPPSERTGPLERLCAFLCGSVPGTRVVQPCRLGRSHVTHRQRHGRYPDSRILAAGFDAGRPTFSSGKFPGGLTGDFGQSVGAAPAALARGK